MGPTASVSRRGSAVVLALSAIVAVLLASGAAAVAQPSADPYRDEQWSLDRLRTDEAWTVARGAGAVVAVVDTGVALDHPDLHDRLVRRPDGSVVGRDLVDDDLDPSDHHGHGTLVAGVIAATADDHGIAGIAPEARILPVRVLAADGSGRSEDVGAGIRWAVDQGADVVNVSIEAVGPGTDGRQAPGVPTDAVRYADERGVLVIAAAGNRPGAASAYPAESPIVLVGAVDRADRATGYSAVGRPDGFVAPGVDILSTWCERTAGGCDVAAAPYGVAEGTSFAAPHVSGVAALLVSAGFGAGEVRERLAAGAVDLGDPGPDPVHGVGRIDAAASLGASRPPVATRSAAESPAVPADPPPASETDAPGGGSVDVAPPAEAEPASDARGEAPDPVPVAPDAAVEGGADDDGSAPAAEDATSGGDGGGDPGDDDERARLVALDVRAAPPRAPVDEPVSTRWLPVLAAGLLGATMACWSSVARAAT